MDRLQTFLTKGAGKPETPNCFTKGVGNPETPSTALRRVPESQRIGVWVDCSPSHLSSRHRSPPRR